MSAPAVESPAWHALRSKGIGASEIATIAGIGRWGSRWALWAEKTGLLKPDPTDATEAMRMGQELEPALAAIFTKRTGLYVGGEQMMLSHPEHGWVRCSVDGMVFEGHNSEPHPDVALGGFEAKYDNGAPWTTQPCDDVVVPPELHDIPPYYQAQAAWQMLATGWERVWFGVLHGWGRYRIYEVERSTLSGVDDEGQPYALLAALFEAGRQFWFEHVLTGVPPALGGPGRDATSLALGHVYGEGGGGEVDVAELEEQLASLRWLKREAKALDEQITDLENVVKAQMGPGEVGLVDGRPLVTWKPSKPRRRIDEKRLRSERPEVAAEFEVEGDPVRPLIPLTPCQHCPRTLRAQDFESHMTKHTQQKETADAGQ